jgi:hypothetical protein
MNITQAAADDIARLGEAGVIRPDTRSNFCKM